MDFCSIYETGLDLHLPLIFLYRIVWMSWPASARFASAGKLCRACIKLR